MENSDLNSKLINMPSVSSRSVDTGLLVSGELYISGCSLFGTEICLYENDVLSQKFICCLNGFFYFKLDYEKHYSVVITKNGYETKTIVFDTALFGYSSKQRYYEFGVSLHPLISESEHVFTAAIVKYNNRIEGFEHDRNHINNSSQQVNNSAA